jgi:hypothetical protein
VPFSGTSQTRNRLIHLWNREFLTVIKNDARIALATAYYDFVNPDSYSTVTPNPSHDGVHWHDRFGPEFWETLVKPALESGASQVGKNWNAVYEDHFDLAEAESTGRGQYDTWARTDQLLSSEGIDRQIVINGVQYSWVRHDQRPLLPETYIELVLT